ncbi:hypothetical protein [Pseudactinotalea sp. HY158]|uniref:hypothetical protein n=1 Tax=Pseudactinotalea sp. HY158 TaxID=2654547 RepID=UPI001E36FB23|nr:hypothetical protein [Pseudactinotalea sp. HY158]
MTTGRAGSPDEDPQPTTSHTVAGASPPALTAPPLVCTVFGHDYHFTADGSTMRWTCTRRCGAGGRKEYADPESAARYAHAFDRRDRDDLGRRAPLIGLFPLRLWRWFERRNQAKKA